MIAAVVVVIASCIGAIRSAFSHANSTLLGMVEGPMATPRNESSEEVPVGSQHHCPECGIAEESASANFRRATSCR